MSAKPGLLREKGGAINNDPGHQMRAWPGQIGVCGHPSYDSVFGKHYLGPQCSLRRVLPALRLQHRHTFTESEKRT